MAITRCTASESVGGGSNREPVTPLRATSSRSGRFRTKRRARYNHAIVREKEVFRYRKADRIRTYSLRPLAEAHAELWVASSEAGKAVRSRKLLTFTCEQDVDVVLQDVQRELRAGGWSEA